jgi:Tfp pilus assembly protein PilE
MPGETTVAPLRSRVSLGPIVERLVVVGVGLALVLTAYAKMGARADETVAQGNLVAVLPLVHEYAVDHGSYAGMTLGALKRVYSSSLDTRSYTLVDRGAADFCIETTYAGRTWRISGSDEQPSPGGCRAPA